MSIKEKIKAKLQEAFISVKDDFRNQKAKLMNLIHMGHGTYKNPSGHEFEWDDTQYTFKQIKKTSIEPSKEIPKSNVLSFQKKSIFNREPEGGWTDTDKVPEDKQKVKTLKDFYKNEPGTESKPISSEPDEITGNPDSYVDKELQKQIKDFAKNFKNTKIVRGVDSNYNGEMLERISKVQIKYKNKWALVDSDGSGQFMIALQDIIDRNGFQVASKGDIRKVKAYGVPNHIWNLGNVGGKYKTDYLGHSFENSEPELVQKVTDHVKKVLDKKDDGEYEVEEVKDDNYGWDSKLISKNWVMRFTSHYPRYEMDLYGDPENIGKRGKNVRNSHFVFWTDDRNSGIGSDVKNEIIKAKPKTYEDVIKLIQNSFEKNKSTKEGTKSTLDKYDSVKKGIDAHIPDFGLEGDYEDINYPGKDTVVTFKKSGIELWSEKESLEAEKSHMNPNTTIAWRYAKKINSLRDELKNANGMGEVHKILDKNKIKYRATNYMDSQFQ